MRKSYEERIKHWICDVKKERRRYKRRFVRFDCLEKGINAMLEILSNLEKIPVVLVTRKRFDINHYWDLNKDDLEIRYFSPESEEDLLIARNFRKQLKSLKNHLYENFIETDIHEKRGYSVKLDFGISSEKLKPSGDDFLNLKIGRNPIDNYHELIFLANSNFKYGCYRDHIIPTIEEIISHPMTDSFGPDPTLI